ncbi:MAG: hypothetical protein J2P49_07700 [Methylocapsa sp.]|nr:hypothetical protein [Methylocapsa sp.]
MVIALPIVGVVLAFFGDWRVLAYAGTLWATVCEICAIRNTLVPRSHRLMHPALSHHLICKHLSARQAFATGGDKSQAGAV